MTWFLFVGDMLVMLFMIAVAVWVYAVAGREEIERSARIPLQDEARDD